MAATDDEYNFGPIDNLVICFFRGRRWGLKPPNIGSLEHWEETAYFINRMNNCYYSCTGLLRPFLAGGRCRRCSTANLRLFVKQLALIIIMIIIN